MFIAAAAKLLLRGGEAPPPWRPIGQGGGWSGDRGGDGGNGGITFVLAAVLAIGMVASQASMPPGAAVAMLTLAALGSS